MAVTKITSYDAGYTTGSLSLFPQSIDSRYQLYETKNNAETKLKNSLTYAAKFVVVDNNDLFPNSGIIKIGPPAGKVGNSEMIYYENKSQGVFRNIIRGFAGSKQNSWKMGSSVLHAVFAEHHNSVKDAILNIENNLGLISNPAPDSLNGILKQQENKFLAPRAIFRAFPTKGPPNTKIRFQNFSTGPVVRYLWDFGDGTTSVEKSPLHAYIKEGTYSVKLNIITALGAQGVSEKKLYITIDQTTVPPFYYITPSSGVSLQTATELGNPNMATKFNFVDQTDGSILQRYWVFDGEGTSNGIQIENQSIAEFNPNIHYTSYVYDKPGNYQPSLLILFENQQLQRAFLSNKVVVD
jgi:PKD repeat protein